MGSARLAYGGRRHKAYRAALVQPHEIQGTNTPLLLTGQDTLLRGVGQQLMYDWSNPNRGRPPGVVDNRGFTESLVSTTLLGQDTIWGAPGQAPDYDLSRGRAYARPIQYEQSPNLQVIQPVPSTPVLPVDTNQPIPRPAYRGNRGGELNLSETTLLGQDLLLRGVGQQLAYDWQLPPKGRPPGPVDNRTLTESLVNTTLFVDPGAPLRPFDWQLPVPDPKRSSPVNRTHWQDLVPNLIGQDTVYGAPGEAPAYDWQLPPKGRPPGPVSNRSLWVDLVTTTLRGQDRIYAGPGQVPVYDWIVPKGYRRSHPPQIFVDLAGTLIYVPPPASAVAWVAARYGRAVYVLDARRETAAAVAADAVAVSASATVAATARAFAAYVPLYPP